jgi:hypothetical protein
MRMIANVDAGPSFFMLGALFPTGKCMDEEDVVSDPALWCDKTKIVGLFTEGQLIAHGRGFQLHLLSDFHASRLLRSTPRSKIPDLFMLDPESWPAQGYLKRFLSARTDVSAEQVMQCRTLRDQYDVISSLTGWACMHVDESGIVIRAFMEAVMHVIQLQFFGIPVEKVCPQESCDSMKSSMFVEGYSCNMELYP